MKIKMQTQYKAFFEGDKNIPQDMEQEFLKKVLAFQENNESSPLVKLHEVIGNPELKSSYDILEEELEEAWTFLDRLLNEHGLVVTFEGDYPLATKYDFVVNELLPLEIQQPAEGHKWIFPYEEFHPNHGLDIERLVEVFMSEFFANKISPEPSYLFDPIITD